MQDNITNTLKLFQSTTSTKSNKNIITNKEINKDILKKEHFNSSSEDEGKNDENNENNEDNDGSSVIRINVDSKVKDKKSTKSLKSVKSSKSSKAVKYVESIESHHSSKSQDTKNAFKSSKILTSNLKKLGSKYSKNINVKVKYDINDLNTDNNSQAEKEVFNIDDMMPMDPGEQINNNANINTKKSLFNTSTNFKKIKNVDEIKLEKAESYELKRAIVKKSNKDIHSKLIPKHNDNNKILKSNKELIKVNKDLNKTTNLVSHSLSEHDDVDFDININYNENTNNSNNSNIENNLNNETNLITAHNSINSNKANIESINLTNNKNANSSYHYSDKFKKTHHNLKSKNLSLDVNSTNNNNTNNSNNNNTNNITNIIIPSYPNSININSLNLLDVLRKIPSIRSTTSNYFLP